MAAAPLGGAGPSSSCEGPTTVFLRAGFLAKKVPLCVRVSLHYRRHVAGVAKSIEMVKLPGGSTDRTGQKRSSISVGGRAMGTAAPAPLS